MTQEKGLTIREDKIMALGEIEIQFALAVRQRELLEKYIKERLKPEKHYYTVGDDPGRKPSLTKEGAELICLPHALKGHYHWLFGPENPPLDDTPYQITVKCELEVNGKFAGDGIGSASSHITTKSGEHKPRQKDPGLRHNATVKMACKSAYIAATLNATAASEFYTQDLEDDPAGGFERQDTAEHWCAEHQAKFFKSAKMTSYGHPIKDEKGNDTGKWCHEHKEKPKAETSEAPPKIEMKVPETLQEFRQWCAQPEIGLITEKAILQELSTIPSWSLHKLSDLKDFRGAAVYLKELRRGPEHIQEQVIDAEAERLKAEAEKAERDLFGDKK